MTNYIFTTVLISLVLTTNLFSQQKQNYNDSTRINWTDEYKPVNSKFFVHNEIEINASPTIVWDLIIDALKWETWYSHAKHVSFMNTSDTVLKANTVFKWNTMGMNFQSEIKQYVPNQLLTWESKKKSVQAYSVWLIVPTDNGCKVITEESQNGWITFLEKIFQPNKLRKHHDVWLTLLKMKSEEKQNRE